MSFERMVEGICNLEQDQKPTLKILFTLNPFLNHRKQRLFAWLRGITIECAFYVEGIWDGLVWGLVWRRTKATSVWEDREREIQNGLWEILQRLLRVENKLINALLCVFLLSMDKTHNEWTYNKIWINAIDLAFTSGSGGEAAWFIMRMGWQRFCISGRFL